MTVGHNPRMIATDSEIYWLREVSETGQMLPQAGGDAGATGPSREGTLPFDPTTHTDIAIIGAGYTGLSAARTLARGGRDVLVLEHDTAGAGASTRNGGFILPGYKRELPGLVRRLGFTRALELFEESLRAMAFVESLIAEEHIECEYRRAGHVTVAESRRQVEELERAAELLERRCRYPTTMLGADAIGGEVGSARYVGGVLDPRAASVQPALLFEGLLRTALAAGVTLAEHARVDTIRRGPSGFTIETSRGTLTAGDVLVATNGYLPPDAELRRRVIPVGSHIIATEPLDRELQRRIIPHCRLLSDCRHLLHYYRLTGDGRLLFGGRAAFSPIGTPAAAALLRRDMVAVFPQLGETRLEYAWSGTLGVARDQMPHAGRLDGVGYACCYGGHGVAMSLYLGHRMGEYLAGGDPPPITGLDFPRIPLYNGRPWFLPLAGAWFRLRDLLDR
ncbi:MAG: FAD-binding oxidoreductase [Gemmatimonadota bacterium]